jgi:hypothetical protein
MTTPITALLIPEQRDLTPSVIGELWMNFDKNSQSVEGTFRAEATQIMTIYLNVLREFKTPTATDRPASPGESIAIDQTLYTNEPIEGNTTSSKTP